MKVNNIVFNALLMATLLGCQSGYQTTKNNQKAESKPTSTVATSTTAQDEIYTVQAGDTVYGISFRSGLNYRDVAAWNNIEEPYTIRIGQKIRLTPPENTHAQVSTPKVAPATVATKPTVAKPVIASTPPTPAKVVTTEKLAAPATVAAPVVTEKSAVPVGITAPVMVSNSVATPIEKPAIAEPVAVSAITWQWPTKGKLIGVFISNDKTNQGINIAGKSGQMILAASDGVVVYSGTGLIGYGELLIIKHNNEWISAYAHNEKRLVAEGTKVKAGQHIADMGRTGAATDMLHFEIRRNGKPVDPLLYLPKK